MNFSANQVNQLGDLQTTYNWIISFNGPSAAPIASEDLHLRCTSTSIPERTSELLEVQLHGHTLLRPGKVTQNGEITLNFVEDVNATVMANLRAIEQAMWSADDVQDSKGTRADYSELKFNITMVLQDHKDASKQTYIIKDCLLKTLSAGGELNSDNDFFKPALTVSYNYFNWKKN